MINQKFIIKMIRFLKNKINNNKKKFKYLNLIIININRMIVKIKRLKLDNNEETNRIVKC